jgi:hypothetical protein
MKTKILLITLLTITVLSACHDDKADEKQALNEVLKVHDQVMEYSETAMKNKLVLDTLIKKNLSDTTKTNTATTLSKQLITADNAMEDWMHKFNADNTGKSHAEIMEYLHGQRLELLKVDTLLKSAIDQSNNFLKAK